MERRIFVCECGALEHQVAFWYDPEEKSLHIQPRLNTHKSFFERLWAGLKYAVGYKSRFGEWDEIWLDPESQVALMRLIGAEHTDQWLSPIENEREWQEDHIKKIWPDYPNGCPRWQTMNGLIQLSCQTQKIQIDYSKLNN